MLIKELHPEVFGTVCVITCPVCWQLCTYFLKHSTHPHTQAHVSIQKPAWCILTYSPFIIRSLHPMLPNFKIIESQEGSIMPVITQRGGKRNKKQELKFEKWNSFNRIVLPRGCQYRDKSLGWPLQVQLGTWFAHFCCSPLFHLVQT